MPQGVESDAPVRVPWSLEHTHHGSLVRNADVLATLPSRPVSPLAMVVLHLPTSRCTRVLPGVVSKSHMTNTLAKIDYLEL